MMRSHSRRDTSTESTEEERCRKSGQRWRRWLQPTVSQPLRRHRAGRLEVRWLLESLALQPALPFTEPSVGEAEAEGST